MGKTQGHSDNVRRKVVELHKSGNGYKKTSKQLKMLSYTVPSRIIGTLSEYEQNRLWKNMSLLFILLVFHSKYSQKSYLFIEVKLLKEKKTVDIK